MKVFITGATGFVGSAVVKELIRAGHQVIGLARSAEKAKALAEAGAQVQLGDVNDLDLLRNTAADVDGIIHTAFNHDFSRFKDSTEDDRRVIATMGDIVAGTRRPLIITSGSALLPQGRLVYENEKPAAGHNPRIATEQAAEEAAAKGVHVSIVRLPPSVHGEEDKGGFIPMLIRTAREKGVSAYINEGLNHWSAVHQLDAALLYRLALEKAAAGGTHYHAAAESHVAFRDIAEAIGRGLNIPVVSKTTEEAGAHFGFLAHFAATDNQTSSQQTQEALNWRPTHPGLIADLNIGFYFQG